MQYSFSVTYVVENVCVSMVLVVVFTAVFSTFRKGNAQANLAHGHEKY